MEYGFEHVSYYGNHGSDGLDDQLWCVDGKIHVCACRETGREALVSMLIDQQLSDDERRRRLDEHDAVLLCDDPEAWAARSRPEWWSVRKSHVNGGDCDGSCRPGTTALDLVARVANMRAETLATGGPRVRKGCVVAMSGPVLPSTVELDAGGEALLAAGQLVGRRIESWYAKRSGKGETWCLPAGQAGMGDRPLRISTGFDWWSGARNGIFNSHRLAVTPCDGSCSPKPVTLTDQMRQALTRALEDRAT